MTPEDETTRKGSSDNPVETSAEDALLFDEYVQGLRELIEDTETPFVLGIYGDWGVGKTSLMHLLQEALEAAEHATVWTNPWKYDQRAEVWKALIREVYSAVRQRVRILDLNQQELREAAGKGVKQLANMLGRRLGVGDTGDELEAMLSLDKAFSNAFESEFDRQLRRLEEKLGEGKRLVVFLDDLDRCSREAVIEVLEALKLYLDRKGCVFVLGVNQEVVQDAVESKYRTTDAEGKSTSPVSGLHYLEKMVQLPFHIPPHDEKRLNEFLERLEVRTRLPAGINRADEWVEYVRRVGEATGNNPRQIKRFINTVRLIARIAPQEVTPAGATEPIMLERLKLAKVVLIQFAFNDFYRVIWRYHSLLFEGQQYAFDLKERRKEGEAGVPEKSRKTRERLYRREEGFTLIDRNPELQQVLTEEPLWDSEEEATCYITYSGGGQETPETPDFDDIQEDLLSDFGEVIAAAARRVRDGGSESMAAHLEELIRRLSDPSADKRQDAAFALWAIGDARAVEPLIAALKGQDPGVQDSAAWALGQIGDKRAVEPLIVALQDQEWIVRQDAAAALGKLGDARAVEPLIDALEDEDEDVREVAAEALEEIDTPEASEAAMKYQILHDL